MGFLSKLFKKNMKELNNKALVNTKSSESISDKQLDIHQDLKELLWIEDGPMRNYSSEINKQEFLVEGLRVVCSFKGSEEPSLISLKLPVNFNVDISTVERPPYFPSYKDLTENQKGVYWSLLGNPYNGNIDIGFVFILYYGLERCLLDGNYEKAFDVILKLRHVFDNGSFQNYSGNALILTCLLKQRVDLADKFIKSLKNEFEYNFSDNLFVLCKYSLDLPLTSKDIIRMAKSFEFTKLNYIKTYPEIFEKELVEKMKEAYSTEDIDIKKFITATEMKKVRKEKVQVYANVSISNTEIDVPLLIECFKFKKAVYDLLEKTHESVKEQLKELRKKGKVESINKVVKAKNVILTFDMEEEERHLKNLKLLKEPLDKHFELISIQEFYYKYRDLDSKYIDECIKYCEIDIEGLKEIGPFDAVIPAFKRLSIIYDKRKEFEQGIAICNKAIEYYKSMNMLEEINEFSKRKDKMVKKFKK